MLYEVITKNKITWLRGRGAFVSGGTTWKLEVAGEGGSEPIEARNVIIATGSKARSLPGIEVDNSLICDNEGALAFQFRFDIERQRPHHGFVITSYSIHYTKLYESRYPQGWTPHGWCATR